MAWSEIYISQSLLSSRHQVQPAFSVAITPKFKTTQGFKVPATQTEHSANSTV